DGIRDFHVTGVQTCALPILVETGKGDTYFAVGSATPAPAIRTALEVIGTEIAAVGNQIVVEGHTDARSYSGNGEYSNWELSVERSEERREGKELRPRMRRDR